VRLVLDVQAIRLLVGGGEEARGLGGVGAGVGVEAEGVALEGEEVVVDGGAFLAVGLLGDVETVLGPTYEDCTVRTNHWALAGTLWGKAKALAARSEARRNFILDIKKRMYVLERGEGNWLWAASPGDGRPCHFIRHLPKRHMGRSM
jgi:hypothetical protein